MHACVTANKQVLATTTTTSCVLKVLFFRLVEQYNSPNYYFEPLWIIYAAMRECQLYKDYLSINRPPTTCPCPRVMPVVRNARYSIREFPTIPIARSD